MTYVPRPEHVRAVADLLHESSCWGDLGTGTSCGCYRHEGDADHLAAYAVLVGIADGALVAAARHALAAAERGPFDAADVDEDMRELAERFAHQDETRAAAEWEIVGAMDDEGLL